MVMERYAYTDDLPGTIANIFGKSPVPGPHFLQSFVFNIAAKGIIGQANGQGIGRHSKEEVRKMEIEDLKALSDFLGSKTFMMGTEEPTELDWVVFGFMCQVLYTMEEEHI
jgi:hypothetical protein